MWKILALNCKIQTSFALNLSQLNSFKCQIIQNADWRKINSSLSEWRRRDPLSWDSFLFLLLTFCLCSQPCICPCWTDSAALPVAGLPGRDTSRWPFLDRADGQQGAAVFPQDLVKLPHKTFNNGESRWQELFASGFSWPRAALEFTRVPAARKS